MDKSTDLETEKTNIIENSDYFILKKAHLHLFTTTELRTLYKMLAKTQPPKFFWKGFGFEIDLVLDAKIKAIRDKNAEKLNKLLGREG